MNVTRKAAKDKDAQRVVATAKETFMDTCPLIRDEFNKKTDKMEGEYLKKINDTVNSLVDRLEKLTTLMHQTAQIAESEMELDKLFKMKCEHFKRKKKLTMKNYSSWKII